MVQTGSHFLCRTCFGTPPSGGEVCARNTQAHPSSSGLRTLLNQTRWMWSKAWWPGQKHSRIPLQQQSYSRRTLTQAVSEPETRPTDVGRMQCSRLCPARTQLFQSVDEWTVQSNCGFHGPHRFSQDLPGWALWTRLALYLLSWLWVCGKP